MEQTKNPEHKTLALKDLALQAEFSASKVLAGVPTSIKFTLLYPEASILIPKGSTSIDASVATATEGTVTVNLKLSMSSVFSHPRDSITEGVLSGAVNTLGTDLGLKLKRGIDTSERPIDTIVRTPATVVLIESSKELDETTKRPVCTAYFSEDAHAELINPFLRGIANRLPAGYLAICVTCLSALEYKDETTVS